MYPNGPDQRVSHETIYAAIYAHPRGGLKQAMIEALRQEKPVRGRRRTTLAGGGFVPEEIELRQLPGHWEGDLIKGGFQLLLRGHAGCERKTRFVVLCRYGRLHCSGRPGGLHAPDEETAGLSAREPDLRSRNGNDLSCRALQAIESRYLVC